MSKFSKSKTGEEKNSCTEYPNSLIMIAIVLKFDDSMRLLRIADIEL